MVWFSATARLLWAGSRRKLESVSVPCGQGRVFWGGYEAISRRRKKSYRRCNMKEGFDDGAK